MAEFLQWLTNNPVVIIVLSIIVAAIVLMYLVAFLQGREVSFWPPKIGSKAEASSRQKDKPSGEPKLLAAGKLVWHNDIPINHEGISHAKTIDWMSITLNRTFPIIKADVHDCIRDGGILRILLIDPKSKVPDILANSGHFNRDVGKVVQSHKATLDQVLAWREEFPGCNIEVRFLPCPPPYRITIMDRHFPTGYLYVRLPVFNNSKNIPTLAIKATDEAWFDFFVDQYEKYWRISRPYLVRVKTSTP